jgi:translation initiation factor eIF-2B subunit alpha
VLRQAARRGSRFSIIVTEGRPDNTGLNMARALDGVGIPTTLVLDSGAAYCLDRFVDCAHCVLWSGASRS